MTEMEPQLYRITLSLILIPSAEVSRILVTSETFALGTEATVSLQRLVRRQKTDQSTATRGRQIPSRPWGITWPQCQGVLVLIPLTLLLTQRLTLGLTAMASLRLSCQPRAKDKTTSRYKQSDHQPEASGMS
uniref:Uncharacterized protein n=1 Tax=Anguilla anguilla TaxID=7936 RepID=A0A0E9UKC5_ANGAN